MLPVIVTLCLGQVQAILKQAEELPPETNPFEGITKLMAIISRAKSADKITLVTAAIMDFRLAKSFVGGLPAKADYDGSKAGSGGKSIVDVFMFRWEVGRYLLATYGPEHLVNIEHLSKMRVVFESIATYRQWCGYPDSPLDMTFRAGWPKSSEKFFQAVEQVLFDGSMDSTLQDSIKKGRSAAEACQEGQLGELLGKFADALDSEKKVAGEEEKSQREQAAAEEDAVIKVGEDEEDDALNQTPEKPASLVPIRSVNDAPQVSAAVKLLKTHCQFISDEGLSQTELAKALSTSAAMTWKPSASDPGYPIGTLSLLILRSRYFKAEQWKKGYPKS